MPDVDIVAETTRNPLIRKTGEQNGILRWFKMDLSSFCIQENKSRQTRKTGLFPGFSILSAKRQTELSAE